MARWIRYAFLNHEDIVLNVYVPIYHAGWKDVVKAFNYLDILMWCVWYEVNLKIFSAFHIHDVALCKEAQIDAKYKLSTACCKIMARQEQLLDMCGSAYTSFTTVLPAGVTVDPERPDCVCVRVCVPPLLSLQELWPPVREAVLRMSGSAIHNPPSLSSCPVWNYSYLHSSPFI